MTNKTTIPSMQHVRKTSGKCLFYFFYTVSLNLFLYFSIFNWKKNLIPENYRFVNQLAIRTTTAFFDEDAVTETGRLGVGSYRYQFKLHFPFNSDLKITV